MIGLKLIKDKVRFVAIEYLERYYTKSLVTSTGMSTSANENRKGLKSLGSLQKFIEEVKPGKIMPFKDKTERARKNLKRAGLIK